MLFRNRADAGERLAELVQIDNRKNTVVLALPRGGVPLGADISMKYSVPLDVVIVKKIGHPLQPEFAIGAIAEGGEPIFNPDVTVEDTHVTEGIVRVKQEITNRRKLYNQFLKPHSLENKDVIIVDDGVATGMTLFAAIEAVKNQNPQKITVAIPVVPKDVFAKIQKDVDEVVAVVVPEQFYGAVGAYYQEFPQVSDQEVQELLEEYS